MGNPFPILRTRASDTLVTERRALAVLKVWTCEAPANHVSLWAWARLQCPPLDWPDARTLFARRLIRGRVYRKRQWVYVDPRIVAAVGLYRAVAGLYTVTIHTDGSKTYVGHVLPEPAKRPKRARAPKRPTRAHPRDDLDAGRDRGSDWRGGAGARGWASGHDPDARGGPAEPEPDPGGGAP